MAKFFGVVGYGVLVETSPGVWGYNITERSYYGDVVRNARKLVEAEKVNLDIAVENSLSIVADAYANNHFFAIRYVEWAGTRWIVEKVDVQPPRLILRLGGVYNGNPPATP